MKVRFTETYKVAINFRFGSSADFREQQKTARKSQSYRFLYYLVVQESWKPC